ncbi:aldo/keto reductase [Actinomycetospora chibensis]|uniref:Aldo/keto reductase n=1 Tax=Actinomycetospora chibensis TaxID=663606 RepID=A0ABV9RE76_9PSEU|nr:aldo/keto reductase [Actinomycetospora chibensis]MDD7925106.1 aldo/keto reductase [Actinomycetospora chibensis]
MSDPTPHLELNDGSCIPQLGFGVFLIDQGDTRETVATALSTGYRHVDTAAAYGNEAQVGEAVRGSGEQVYVTTKYFNPGDDHGRSDATAAFGASFDRLGLDHIDLYLIHWPVRAGGGFVESWRALTQLRTDAPLRSIGVSNFSSAQLERIVDATGVTPAVNQVELHPYFQQTALRRYHAQRGIATEAWGPLGQGNRHAEKVLADPVLARIGRAHGRTAGQVVIRWHLQIGTIVIPKSGDPSRIRENFAVFDFELTADDMAAIAALDRGGRNGPDPDTYDFPKLYRGRAHDPDQA